MAQIQRPSRSQSTVTWQPAEPASLVGKLDYLLFYGCLKLTALDLTPPILSQGTLMSSLELYLSSYSYLSTSLKTLESKYVISPPILLAQTEVPQGPSP